MKKSIALHFLCALFTLFVFACASNSPRNLEHVERGMDKDQVLSLAGNPQRTFRKDDSDHWLYTYEINGKEWHREVVFERGKVTDIIRRASKEEWQKDLERSDSMEEFEKKARAHEQKSEKGSFQPVDGGPADATGQGK